MKINLFITLILFLSLDCFGEYEELKKNKYNVKRKDKINEVRNKSKLKNKYMNLLEIKYYDINQMNTDSLEVKYDIFLWQCIADGICVFRYKGNENINFVIQTIKNSEKSIKNIREYKEYNFKLF